jgi:GNAT superfamily N-acetyltransferase
VRIKRTDQKEFESSCMSLIEIAKAFNRTNIVNAIMEKSAENDLPDKDKLKQKFTDQVAKIQEKKKNSRKNMQTYLTENKVSDTSKERLFEIWDNTDGVESMAQSYIFQNDQKGFVAFLPNGTVCGVMKVQIKKDCVYVDNLAACPPGTGAGASLLAAAADLSEGIGKGGRLRLADEQGGHTSSKVNFYDKFGFEPFIGGSESNPWTKKNLKERDRDKPAIKKGQHNADREKELAFLPAGEYWRNRWIKDAEQGARSVGNSADIRTAPVHAIIARESN